uniref:NADH dehydrogenase subunit 4L n=1 Tax=Gromphadorhina portentosa TaxID=36953 RepID=A0A146AFC0_GROPO|nr:NADH dehydrogenase subunit 4L [Gromphadorhina portentosa]AMW91049.1 NADH dehydrogenase subunit 4L [Gromphadorhina portentosa]
MSMYIYVSLGFFSGIWVFCSNRKHLLATLLSLEFIVLILYVVLYNYLMNFNYELYFMMVFLTFSVCEGAFSSINLSFDNSWVREWFLWGL